MGWNLLLGPIADLVGDVVKRYLPAEKMSEKERTEAEMAIKLAIMTAEDTGLQTRMSAILAEAKSADPWTSRARPSFLYVMYLMVLAAIPMGVLAAFKPDMATAVAEGMQAWLAAIPDGLWAIFGTGYLGYSAARSYDKGKMIKGAK